MTVVKRDFLCTVVVHKKSFFIENGMRILLDQMGILNNSLVPKRSEHA